MHCNVTKEQLHSWIDNDAAELEVHLAGCPKCRKLAAEYREQISVQQQDDTATVDVLPEERPHGDPSSSSTGAISQSPEYIGPYRIGHELGRGGMGIVYLGVLEEGNIRQQVAVKVLKRGTTRKIHFVASSESVNFLQH